MWLLVTKGNICGVATEKCHVLFSVDAKGSHAP